MMFQISLCSHSQRASLSCLQLSTKESWRAAAPVTVPMNNLRCIFFHRKACLIFDPGCIFVACFRWDSYFKEQQVCSCDGKASCFCSAVLEEVTKSNTWVKVKDIVLTYFFGSLACWPRGTAPLLGFTSGNISSCPQDPSGILHLL